MPGRGLQPSVRPEPTSADEPPRASISATRASSLVPDEMKQGGRQYWKLACPPGELVFPNSKGNLDFLANIIQRGLIPAVTVAGLTVDGKAKYSGMHLFRHFYASWCIDRGLPPKVIQERLGHSSITMTFDRYGHLFPRTDDKAEIDAAELQVIAG